MVKKKVEREVVEVDREALLHIVNFYLENVESRMMDSTKIAISQISMGSGKHRKLLLGVKQDIEGIIINEVHYTNVAELIMEKYVEEDSEGPILYPILDVKDK